MVDRTATATRQLASARRRVRGAAPTPDPDLARQRKVVEAFLAAAREGGFERLLAALAPDAVLAAFVTGTTLVIDGGMLAGTPPFTTRR